MKVYRITYTEGYKEDRKSKTVLAKDIAQAVEYAARNLKKSHWNFEILDIEFILKVDVHYKA